MKYFILIGCLSLTGCMYQTIDQFDIRRAAKFCGGVDKIVEIESTSFGRENALCTNGKYDSLFGVSAE